MKVAQKPVAEMRGSVGVQHHEALATEPHAKDAAARSRDDVIAKAEAAGISDETELNPRRSAEAAQATALLTQVQWCLSECPDTRAHRDAFHKILGRCHDYAKKFRGCNLQTLLISNDFPCSMRAWTLIPHLALQELAHRKLLPRFITDPKDAQIRDHANRAPRKLKDPDNVSWICLFIFLACVTS